MSHSAPLPLVLGARRRPAGFTLLEVAVTLTLLASMTLALLLLWRTEGARAQGRLAGQQYRVVETALNDYLGLYYAQLLTLPEDCAQVDLAVGRSLASSASVAAGHCTLSLPLSNGGAGNLAVANGLQPSFEDLQALRLLDAGLRPGLALPVQLVVAQPDQGLPGTEPAPPRLAVRIEKRCASPDCRSFTLNGLIFNTQPYSYGQGRSVLDSEEMALNAFTGAGPQAALSSPRALQGDGELQGWLGSFRIANPLRLWAPDGSSEGLPGVLGVRVVLGSARLGGLALADGSHTTTGPWNFQGHDVTGVRLFRATQADLGQAQVQDLQVAGTATISTLNTQTANTQTANTQRLSVERLRLPRGVSAAPCDAATESLALASDASTLLVCRGGVWSLPLFP